MEIDHSRNSHSLPRLMNLYNPLNCRTRLSTFPNTIQQLLGMRPTSILYTWRSFAWSSTTLSTFPALRRPHAKIFPLSTALMFLVVDTLFLAFLLWWLSQAWQGKYGKAKPWCFCLMPKYMCSKGPRRYSNIVTPGTSESEPVLSIQHLRKVFRDGKVAVDDLSLEVFPGEIFALLGHNGAGKTTALNCAVGLTSATSGDLIINGYNVETDLELARQQMSVCPQDNPLFEEFTVKQHLAYFSPWDFVMLVSF